MTDYSFNTIIDTSTLQIGQVVRINFTDEGIFRVFYNDSNGNMYCGLNRQSNYRQVIFDSAHKRTQIDISSSATDYIALNKFNPPIYGGTYHEEQMRIPIDRNDKNFYVFKYDNVEWNNNKRKIEYFSEIQVPTYIKQGSTSGSIYNSDGYSPDLASGKNPMLNLDSANRDIFDYFLHNQMGFCVSAEADVLGNTYADVHSRAVAIPFPDTLDLYGQTINNITNKPLNTNYSYLSNLSDISIQSGKNISRFSRVERPFSETLMWNPVYSISEGKEPDEQYVSAPDANRPDRNMLYTVSNKRPKYVWLDDQNNATRFADGIIGTNTIPIQYDTYYKGIFYLYAMTYRKSDISGNIYIERHNRNSRKQWSHKIFTNFANTKNLNQGDIRNIFLDMDLDISKNSTINSGNFNYIYSRPYYVICSDLSGQIVHGTVPYDLSGNSEPLPTDQHIVDISGMSKDQNPNDNFGNSNPFYNLVGTCAKYCKIMVDTTSLNWKTTRYHIIYYAQGGANETDSHTKNTLRWISGEGKSSYDLCGNITTVENSGLYPSMDMSGNVPYVAYLCKGTDTATDISGIGYSYLDNTDANKENWIWTTPRLIATKEDLGGDLTKYTDVSNNHPISLKISPYDYSVHICYQKFNTDGKTSIGYWSNSKNTMDISGIDASLNFLGIKSYGRTIDVSAASVELFWDLSQCNCIFSRDYTRLDENGNTNGLGIPQRKIKIQGYPEGGRNGGFVKSIDEDGVITYRASALDKLYIIMNIKTPSSWRNTEALFLLGESSYQGAYKSFINLYGYVSFGITNQGQNSSKSISTNNTGVYYKLSYKTDNNNNITLYTGAESLDTNTNYKLEFYYDKSNYYGFIKTTILDTETTNLYEYFDISKNGGFNMLDGNLSIGNGSHTADSNKITDISINRMSMYATDISNIPMFDVSRNGEILDDCSGTHFSSFFDNSGNTGLDIEPIVNKYQVVNAVNSLNNGDISGSSYDKSVMLNDIYYLQQIEGYSQSSYGEVIKGISRFDDGEIWAHGYIYNDSGKTSKSTALWRSFNGFEWSRFPVSINGFENFTINNIATFTDNNSVNGISGKWIYFCGDNDLVYFSSNYDENNQPSSALLGNVWINLDGGEYLKSDISLNYTYVYPTLLDNTLSTNLFPGLDISDNDFHLFLGTKSGEDRIIRMGKNKKLSIAAYFTFIPIDYNFSNCSATGRLGPTQAQCNTAYNNTNITVTINTQGIQEWTVPFTGSYTIEAIGASGADGGRSNVSPGNYPGFKGAKITATFNLTQGEVIYILVGQRGQIVTGNYGGGGGGGGTFVVKKNSGGLGSTTVNDVLIVAGGGGGRGAGWWGTGGGSAGQTTLTSSTSGGLYGQGYDSGGGGGLLSNGQITSYEYIYPSANYRYGISFKFGGIGGDVNDAANIRGGFGGGGSGGAHSAGGGGGMSGGNAGPSIDGGGHGGGSFIHNIGSGKSAVLASSLSQGSVKITGFQRIDYPGTKNWDLSKNILYNEIISSDLISYSGNDIWDTQNSYNIDLSIPGTIKRGSGESWEEWAISKNYFNSKRHNFKLSFKMAGATTNSYVLLNRNFTLSTDVDGNIGHQSTNAYRGYGFFIHGAPFPQENKRIGYVLGSSVVPYFVNTDGTYITPTTNNTFTIEVMNEVLNLYMDSTLLLSSNVLVGKNYDLYANVVEWGQVGIKDVVFKPITSLNAISFGQPYRGITDLSDNLSNLGFGIIGTNNHIYVTNNGGKNWTKKLDFQQSNGTTGVYVGQNTKYGDGDSVGDHTYDISGFHIQTNSKPWVGYNGFLVADNNNNYDVSFSPINNSISNPQLYTNNYWEPQATSLYKLPIIERDLIENNYKVIISNLKNTNNKSGLKYQQNDIVYTQTPGNNNVLYLKNSDYNHWQKIDVSPINEYYITSQSNYQNGFSSIIPIDISRTVIHIDGNSGYNNMTGFYTVSKVPPTPEIGILYPASSSDITLAILEVLLDFNKKSYLLKGDNNTALLATEIGDRLRYGIETEYQYQERGIDIKPWNYIPRSEGDNYLILFTVNVLEQGKRYVFRCRLKNKYGHSEWSNVSSEISIPAYDPFITNISYRNKILENKVLWNVGLTNNSQTVYSYDISKSYVDNRYQIVRDYDFDEKYNYNDISGVVGPYSFNAGNLETVEWDETMSHDISFNHIDDGLNLITAGSNVSDSNLQWFAHYAVSKYVIEKKPEIFDISINFQMNKALVGQFGLVDLSDNYSSGTPDQPVSGVFDHLFFQGDYYDFPDDDASWSGKYKIRIFEADENYTGGYRIRTINLGLGNEYNYTDIFSIVVKKENEIRFYYNNVEIGGSGGGDVFRPTPNYPLKIIYRPVYNISEKIGLYNVQATKISPFDISSNWTSRFDSNGNEIFDISKVSFIDKDLSFNTTYLYGVTARAIPVDGVVKTEYFETALSTDSGIPEKFNYNYKVNNANLTLSWTKVININDNISAVWDISWNEKRKDGKVFSGIFSTEDSSFTFTNGNSRYIRTYDYSGARTTTLHPDANYSFQIRGKYSKPNQTNLPTFISKFSNLIFYNYNLEPPIFKEVSYNLQTNRINVLWTEPKRPTIPDYYDISMVNITSKYDISYNFSQTLNNFSDNGLTYYPGKYKMQVRAVHNGGINLNTVNNYKYQFTNCGATGRLGPTQSQCDASYNGTNINVTINTQGIQEWTVPVTGSYKITAIGAAGGDRTIPNIKAPPQFKGGKVTGTFYLTKGDVYQILVGQKGEDSDPDNFPPPYTDDSRGAGGGGATYIVKKSISLSANTVNDILVVAGGGGGIAKEGAAAAAAAAAAGGSGDAFGFMPYDSYNDTTGGVEGEEYAAGGGGGFNGNGAGHHGTNFAGGHSGGYSFKNGGMGGTKGKHSYIDTSPGEGGFGGGGGGSSAEGGSGGGFRGGDGSRFQAILPYPDKYHQNGGGGYSYSSKRLNSTFVVNDVISHGSVSIEFIELGEQSNENTIVFPFTNCNASGRFGPTQSQCDASYIGTDVSVNMTIPGIQEWIVPETGTYIINTKGAMGGWCYTGNPGSGNNPPTHPGYGAILEGDFYLTKGDIYYIAVGQKGKTDLPREVNSNSSNGGGGGGGGTFVWKKGTTTPLIIAGGGGGQAIIPFTINGRGENASLTEDGNVSSETWHDPSNVHGTWYPAGTNGGDGGTHSGASRGWNSIISNLSDNMPGRDLPSNNYGGDGGFGGGGFNASHGGGGGGGYSGGGSESFAGGFPWTIAGGGGGGSYFNSVGNNRRDSTTLGYNQDNGSVTITLASHGKSLKSDWTPMKEFNVPYHSIKNLKITPYNKNHIKDLVDVSYIRLDWDDMVKCNLSDNFGINIPDKFYVIRKWSSKGFNYLPDYQKVISKDSVSYLDQTYPLGSEITWPRQYKYDISANYNFDLVPPVISEVTGVVTTALIDNTPEYTFYTDESGTIVITGASSDNKSASLGENTISFNTLAPGTYSNITIMIRDSVGNNSNILTVNTFTIDPFPLLTEVTPVTPSLTNDTTPSYTFSSDTAASVTITGATLIGLPNSFNIGLNQQVTITFGTLTDGTYDNITIKATDIHGNESNTLTVSSFTIDTTSPQISQVTPVTPSLTNNNRPTYTFYSNEAGTNTVNYPDGRVGTRDATVGDNLIIFSTLSDGTYNNITIKVTDSIGNESNILTVPQFTVDTVAPVISEKTAVTTPTRDTTPNYTFSSDKEGTITITGATASATSVINGDNTITFNTLTQGTYNNIKIKVTDNAGNISNEFTISPFTIIPPPQIIEAAAVTTPTNDSTPNYTFNSDSTGTITITGATSSTTNAIVGNNTISFNTLLDGTYDNIAIKVTDSQGYDSNILTVSSFTISTVAPVISEQTAVTTPTTDKTPNYIFSTDKAGTITITGASSSTTNATVGNNTITFNSLSVGTYNNITIKVTDNVGNVSNTLTVTSFTITEDLTSPQIAEVNPVTTPSSNKTPQYSFSSDEAGTITITGATSSTTNAIVGTNIITFDELLVGTYNDITIKVTDSAENDSNILSVSSFTILDIINISQVTPVPTLTNDNTPQYTFSSDKTGAIIISGASSATTNATVGNNTISFNILSDGTYNNITIKVRDSYGTDSNTLTVNTFTVDTTAPQIYEVTQVSTPTTDTGVTSQYSFFSNEAGTITITGASSATTNAIVGTNTIIFNELSIGTYNNITIKVTDNVGHDSNTLTVTSFTIGAQINQVGVGVSSTVSYINPFQYTFSSNTAGTITISGSAGASSATTNAIVGNNTITFDTLPDGTYGNKITIKVTDSVGNESNTITVPSFRVLHKYFRFTRNGSTSWSITENGVSLSGDNPTISLERGRDYWFRNVGSTSSHRLNINTQNSTGTSYRYPGITGNGTHYMLRWYSVPNDAPNTLYYNSEDSSSMSGIINITGSGDTTAPQINEVTPVTTPTTDTTPQYSFSSDEAGTITITGASSATTNAIVGTNTITFNALSSGTYNNITIKVTDSAGNDSNILTVNNFTIAESIFSVTSSGSSSYLISENGVSLSGNNPSISLQRGKYYVFNINASGHPFNINTQNSTGTSYLYSSGITGQGAQSGSLTFSVPQSAPNTLYYNCQYHSSMAGIINITS